MPKNLRVKMKSGLDMSLLPALICAAMLMLNGRVTKACSETFNLNESHPEAYAVYPTTPRLTSIEQCTWNANGIATRSMVMEILTFAIKFGSCSNLQLGVQMHSGRLVRHLCMYNVGHKEHARSFQLQYTPSSLSETRGFHIKFSLCGFTARLNTTNDSITITSPNYPSNYPQFTKCNWRVYRPHSETHKSMRIHIARFTTYFRPDFLKIDDYKNIYSYRSAMNYPAHRPWTDLRFETTDNPVKYGFTLTIRPTTAAPRCGGHLVIPGDTMNGTFHHPPNGTYNPLSSEPIECLWYIESALGVTFDLFIETFSFRCSSEQLVDGIYTKLRSIKITRRFCQLSNRNVKEHIKFGAVHFHRYSGTWYSYGRGFKFRYLICGLSRSLTSYSENLVITSPRYPSSYPHDANCSWTISAPESSTTHRYLKVRLTALQLQTSGDYLHIGDSPRLSGSMTLALQTRTWYSSSSSIQIRFLTNAFGTGSGFSLTVSAESSGAICGSGTFTLSSTTDTKTIISPQYPQNYSSYLNCSWTVSAPSSSTTHRWLYITADRIDIEPDTDFLYIDNYSPVSGIISTRRIWHTHGPTTNIRFTSNARVQLKGFSLTVTATNVAPVDCGGNNVLSGNQSEGQIQWPLSSPASTTVAMCPWTVSDEKHRSIEVILEDFSLRTSGKCTSASLDVKLTSLSTETTFPLCSSSASTVGWRNFGRNLVITFWSSDTTLGTAGFRLRYKVCGGVYPFSDTNQVLILTNPSLPSGHPDNVYCEWTIVARPPITVLNLTVQSISLASNAYLEIGNSNPRNVTSTMTAEYSQAVTIRFQTVGSSAGSSFNVKASITDLCPTIQCSHNCRMVDGTPQCSCPTTTGWTLGDDSLTCHDVDECAPGGSAVCRGFARCVNTIGSYVCNCTDGYHLSADGRNCTDRHGGWTHWSEWSACSVTCEGGQRSAFRTCTRPTTQGVGLECLHNDGVTRGRRESRSGQCNWQPCPTCSGLGCSYNCTKINGYPTCLCPNADGWRLDSDGKTCIDIDECAPDYPNGCQGSAHCINRVGNFSCYCTIGYKLSADGRNCTDRDGGWSEWSSWSECSEKCAGGIRNATRTCTHPKTEGHGIQCLQLDTRTRAEFETRSESCNEHRCLTCPEANCSHSCEIVNNVPRCSCPRNENWTLTDYNRTCVDVNECGFDQPRMCFGYSECINTPGSYRCNCTDGYKISHDGHSCVDRDGGWSEWGNWTSCLTTCKRTSKRTCTQPVWQGDGEKCLTLDKKTRLFLEMRSETCSGGECDESGSNVFIIISGVVGGISVVLAAVIIAKAIRDRASAKKLKSPT